MTWGKGGGGATHSINIQIDTEWQRRARELQPGKVWNGCPNKSFIFICPLKRKIPPPPPAAQLAALGINKKNTHTPFWKQVA